jgi:hypothetical protein
VELSSTNHIHDNHKNSNAEPSLTMTDLGAPAAESEGVISHKDAMCDECGMYPILGTRYVASHIYGYDICQLCFHDHTPEVRNKFVAFLQAVNQIEARQVYEAEDNLIVNASTEKAAGILEHANQVTAMIGIVPFIDGMATNHDERSTRLQRAIAFNTHIETMHLFTFVGGIQVTSKLLAQIARGITANTSIKRLHWHIGNHLRDEIFAAGLCEILTHNTTLEALFLGEPVDITRDGANVDIHVTLDGANVDIAKRSNQFATTIFDALKQNSTLTTIRLNSYSPLSETTKEVLLEAIQTNKTIRNVHTEFEHPDHRLDLLLACNRKKWIERLADPGATKRQLMEIFYEALHETTEPVSTFYHLLRSRPDMLCPAMREECHDPRWKRRYHDVVDGTASSTPGLGQPRVSTTSQHSKKKRKEVI